MENLEENVYAKKYLVNYRYLSPQGKIASYSQDLKCVNSEQTGDVNKNQDISSHRSYRDHNQSGSTKYRVVENVASNTPSLSSKHSLSNSDCPEPKLKKLKPGCYELEEEEEVRELESLAKLKSDLVMERFTDLSSETEADLAWLSKVVAQDHSYHRRRGVQF